MEKIVISSKARIMLDELVDILYYENYFSYKTSAQDYVNNIYDFISTIPALRHKPTQYKVFGLTTASINIIVKHPGVLFLK